MPDFDYITDDEMRQSLQSDWCELASAYEVKAWKAVHVLAGSISEAAIIDFLLATEDIHRVSQSDLMKMAFADLVGICKKHQIISERASDLSSVIRTYRNLIHPGRALRLRETVTLDTATVAKSLVNILVSELEVQKRKSQGYSSKQLVSKISADHTVLAILPHLLSEMAPRERRRLILEDIPNTYMLMLSRILDDDVDSHTLDLLKRCHRVALDLAEEGVKTEAARRYVEVLRKQTGEYIGDYELAFFRGSDLHYVETGERPLVASHLLDRMKNDPSLLRIEAIKGVFGYVTGQLVTDFAHAILSAIANEKAVTKAASDVLTNAYETSVQGTKDLIRKSVRIWVDHVKARKLVQCQARLADVQLRILGESGVEEECFKDGDIPF